MVGELADETRRAAEGKALPANSYKCISHERTWLLTPLKEHPWARATGCVGAAVSPGPGGFSLAPHRFVPSN